MESIADCDSFVLEMRIFSRKALKKLFENSMQVAKPSHKHQRFDDKVEIIEFLKLFKENK